MRAILAAAAMGLVILAACNREPGKLSAAQGAAIRDSVQATLAAYQKFSAAGQWDSVASLYVNDASLRWVTDGQVELRSVGDLRKYMAELPAGTSIRHEYQDTEILPVVPGVASVLTEFQTTLAYPSSPAFSFGGTMTMLFVHRPAGWRILAGHASTPSSTRR